MSEQPAGDKSFDATPERLRKARQEGDLPTSPEVTSLAASLGIWLGLAVMGAGVLPALDALSGAFVRPEALSAALLAGESVGLTRAGAGLILPLVLPGAALVVAGLAAQRAVSFAPKKLKPKLDRIDPVKGLSRRYGPQGLAEFARAAVKLVGVATLGALYLWGRRDAYGGMIALPPEALPAAMRAEGLRVLGLGLLVMLLAAAIDLPWRRAQHARRLRMTRQEVQDENKENEGDPTLKQSRRRRAQEVAKNQMLRDAGEATVVIVNPTHYAVALKWSRGDEAVPVCVAKGTDHLALAIRARAAGAGVPVREDPPTARALHASVEVGEPIKQEHYAAVAAAIRFADRVRR